MSVGTREIGSVRPGAGARLRSADNLKVLLVVGVIVAHATMAWTGQDQAWVLTEPAVREPLLTLLMLASLVGVMFAMATFFVLAGGFTPQSFARKGLRRYVGDRTLRLGVPLVLYLLLLAPVVEYIDVREEGTWAGSFVSFLPYAWTHPAPGPLWFLEVLWLFSVGYAVLRTCRPPRPRRRVLRPRLLVVTAVLVGLGCFAVRLVVGFGQEVGHTDLYLGQAPVWLAGFTLGVLGAEQGWLEDISPATSRWLFRTAWATATGVVLLVAVAVGALGADLDPFFGGPTWQSLVLAGLQGLLVATMPLWLIDVFRRRFTWQGQLLQQMSRAAFAAYVVHQVVLLAAVLATRATPWPPEIDYLAACTLAVVGSFTLGAALVRIPAAARIL
jgi:fucose 4-O-acetylase-like acetyltransferase